MRAYFFFYNGFVTSVEEKKGEQDTSSRQHSTRRRRESSSAPASAVGAVRQPILSQMAEDESRRRVDTLISPSSLPLLLILTLAFNLIFPAHNLGHAEDPVQVCTPLLKCLCLIYGRPLRGKWYCVMNTWNMHEASCSMPQSETEQN